MRGAWRSIAATWLATRLLVLGCALVVQATGFPDSSFRPSLRDQPGALLTLWDGYWYRIIAQNGYLPLPGYQSDPAFFPLLPVLLRGAHATGLPWSVAGILIANAAFLAGLIALYELGRVWLPDADAARAARYAAVLPMSFAFSMVYPEGLGLAALAAAGLLAHRGRWLTCALVVGLGTLARPEVALAVLPIAAVAWSRRHELGVGERGRAFAAVLAAPAAVVSFSGYLWWAVGDPLAWTEAERAWGRGFSFGGLYRAFEQLPHLSGNQLWFLRDVAACAVYAACQVAAARLGLPRAWLTLGVAIVFLPLTSGTFMSAARFGLLSLPVYWGLAALGRRRATDVAIVVASAVLLAAATIVVPLAPP